jgi:hypothetical protein
VLVFVLLYIALHLVCCRAQAVAAQVLQPAPLQPVQQDAEGRLLPVQPGAAMDRQKWQLMAKASGWTQGELLLLLLLWIETWPRPAGGRKVGELLRGLGMRVSRIHVHCRKFAGLLHTAVAQLVILRQLQFCCTKAAKFISVYKYALASQRTSAAEC